MFLKPSHRGRRGRTPSVVNLRLDALGSYFTGRTSFETDLDRVGVAVLGQGDGNQEQAEAHVTARLEALSEDQTQLKVDVELQLEGRFAQLGRGIIPDVSSVLAGQFGDNLGASTGGKRMVSRSRALDFLCNHA